MWAKRLHHRCSHDHFWDKERAQGRQGKSLVMFMWKSPSGEVVPARYVPGEVWDGEADRMVEERAP